MKIKGSLANSKKTVGELFIVAKKFHQQNLTELKAVESNKRRELANKVIKLKKKVYLREAKRAKSDAYNELANLIKSAKENYKKSINEATLDCIQLIESICIEIIGEEFSKNSKIIENKVKEEINKLENKQFVIASNQSEINNLKAQINSTFVSDNNIPIGVAEIRTESGSIHINWREHLKEIVQMLKEKNA